MRQILSIVVLALLAAFAVTGCVRSTQIAQPLPAPEAQPYRLDSGDRVRIDVFGQPDMSGEQIVDGNGAISLPLIGLVEARGQTAEQLRGRIVQRLGASQVIVNPNVNVQITGYRPFFILGEVRAPGQFSYVEGMTVLTAVAIAGGFTFRADQESFTITRKEGGQFIEQRAQRNTPVYPGDVVNVQERIF